MAQLLSLTLTVWSYLLCMTPATALSKLLTVYMNSVVELCNCLELLKVCVNEMNCRVVNEDH